MHRGSTRDSRRGYPPAEDVTPADDTIPTEETHPDDITPELAQSFFKSEAAFMAAGLDVMQTFSEITYGTPEKYMLFDIDGDSAKELLVQLQPSYDVMLIDKKDGMVTGYYLPIRTANEIKTDGTSSWSASAFTHGVHRIVIGEELTFEEVICYDNSEKKFTVNGVPVTESECREALDRQNAKENVPWLDIASVN